MAIDTEDERRSAAGFLISVPPVPDGAIDDYKDRRQAQWLYRFGFVDTARNLNKRRSSPGWPFLAVMPVPDADLDNAADRAQAQWTYSDLFVDTPTPTPTPTPSVGAVPAEELERGFLSLPNGMRVRVRSREQAQQIWADYHKARVAPTPTPIKPKRVDVKRFSPTPFDPLDAGPMIRTEDELRALRRDEEDAVLALLLS